VDGELGQRARASADEGPAREHERPRGGAADEALAADARVFVVIPAYHEERLLPRTLAKIPAWIERIVVVDDGSGDRTSVRARASGDRRVEVLRHEKNRGVGAAIATGYAHAFRSGADVAVVMGADDQMDPRDLARLVRPVLAGEAGYAKGDRLSHPACLGSMPAHRVAGNVVLTLLTRVATGLRVRDSQCGYTALGREAAEKLDVASLWPRYGYPNDLLGRCAETGVVVRDVVVRPIYADEESDFRWSDAVVRIPLILSLYARRRALVGARRASRR
jgi:glycosyltransferase involved in cell wall biosynthesis